MDEELTHTSLDQFDEQTIRDIQAKYAQSGLYRNDGSTEPLWTYDGRWNASSAIIAPDGEHVIVEGDWTHDEYGLRAVEFARKGRCLRYYYDTEIIPQWILKAVLNGFSPPTCAETTFNAKQMTYTIRTNQAEEIVFDAKSGDIIDIRSPSPVLYSATFVALGIVLAISVNRWRHSARKARN